jgi:acyl dehydratase
MHTNHYAVIKHLNSYLEIATIPDKHTYTSPPKTAKYLWTLLFGFLSGDLNPIHINPLTSKNYKSRLGGLARHGISTLAQAESFIFKIFSFTEPTEVIAKGYNSIRYFKPVNMGDKITYTYTLLRKKVVEEKKYAECIWQVKGTNQKGTDVFVAEWIIIYSPIEKNIIKAVVYPLGWLFGPMEVHDTPLKVWGLRLWIFICVGVIVWLFAKTYLDK